MTAAELPRANVAVLREGVLFFPQNPDIPEGTCLCVLPSLQSAVRADAGEVPNTEVCLGAPAHLQPDLLALPLVSVMVSQAHICTPLLLLGRQ